MPRVCSIHQPSYWPYLGLFDKVARSDVFVFLDDVQYVKNEFKNRNKLFTQSVKSPDPTRVDWLTLPVRHESLAQTIRGTQVTNLGPTLRKHWATISQAYGAVKGFRELKPELEQLYGELAGLETSLADVNAATTRFVFDKLGITTEIFGMSSAITGKSDDPTQRLIDICRHVGADTYLAGAGAANYMNADEFARAGIALQWQDWHPFPYPQAHSLGKFTPYLCSLDLLLNCGAESAAVFRHSLQL
jgi:WbqC-like protein family